MMTAHAPTLILLVPNLELHSLVGEASSHVLLRRGRTLMIDCHSRHMPRWLQSRGLAAPQMILHTHVDPLHCREANLFPAAAIWVARQSADLAEASEVYRLGMQTRFDHPELWGETFGAEPYGIAGSQTLFPPRAPLKIAGGLQAGQRIMWEDVQIDVLDMPGHGRNGLAFLISLDDAPLALFCGDLVCQGGLLPRLWDMELNYVSLQWSGLRQALATACQSGATLFVPSSGYPIEDGPAAAGELRRRIDEYERLTQSTSTLPEQTPPALSRAGRWIERMAGAFQMDNGGNSFVLIAEDGRGLMVDPGPCDYLNPQRQQAFADDLAALRPKGLKSLEWALITHPHGDHYDMVPTLRRIYPGVQVAAWDGVARVMEAPWDYPYPALLPWYGLGFDYVHPDLILTQDAAAQLGPYAIQTAPLPGHCQPHAAYFLTHRGRRLALTGDTVQCYGQAMHLLPNFSNDPGFAHGGGLEQSLAELLRRPIDLNLGGHGSCFLDCQKVYQESLLQVRRERQALQQMLGPGGLARWGQKPGYPQLTPWA